MQNEHEVSLNGLLKEKNKKLEIKNSVVRQVCGGDVSVIRPHFFGRGLESSRFCNFWLDYYSSIEYRIGMTLKRSPFLIVLSGALVLGAYAQAQSFLTNGLIAYYPFNDSAIDASGNGFNGVVTGSCVFAQDRFGNPDYALSISNNQSAADSDTGRVSIPISTINGLTAGTISAWVNPEDITSGDIVSKQHSGVSSYAIFSIGSYVDNGGQPHTANPGTLYFHSQDGSSGYFAASTASVATGAWKQVVVVFSTNSCSFYINGVLCGTTNGDFSIPDDLDCDSENIGCWTGEGFLGPLRLRFDGAIDDVRIYGRALSCGEVAQLYALETPPIINIQKAVYVTSDNLWTGTNYQLQMSSDLINWTNQGSVFTATTNYWRSTNYWDVANWNQLFFRLQQAP